MMAKHNRQGYVDSGRPVEDEGIHSSSAERRSDDSGDDERLNDERGQQASRETETRESETREITSADRLAAFQRQLFQSALPDLPPLPGFHVCWLTTTNARDPIAGRLRLGYELIRCTEIPEFNHTELKLGDYAGCIGVNEMVAAKLPLHLYEMYMNEAHHVAPLQEEEKLQSVTQVIAEEAQRKSGKAPEIGSGTASLGKGPAVGKFEEVDRRP
jgi:hypothetical protein